MSTRLGDANLQTLDTVKWPNTVIEHINRNTSPLRYYKDKPISLRLEGLYFTPADPSRYQTVVCLVAGTGISSGKSLVKSIKKGRSWTRCIVLWSVREVLISIYLC